MSKTNTMARMPVITGIPIPSAMPRLSFTPIEMPFGTGDDDDEEARDCMVDIDAREGNVVDEGKVVAVDEGDLVAVAPKVDVIVAEDDPD